MKKIYSAKDKRPIELIEKLGEGGEAKCFSTRCGFVAKIYHKPERQHRLKLEAMIRNAPHSNGSHPWFAWPLELLIDSNGRFVGYLMLRIIDRQK